MADDWLVDENELTDNYQRYVSDREWNSLKNEFTKFSKPSLQAGYREGVKQGADTARQRGFEEGFAQGGPLLHATGYQIGLLDTLKTFYARSDAPALSDTQRSELDALVHDLAAQSDQSLLQETDVTRRARAERIERLVEELQLGTVPRAEN